MKELKFFLIALILVLNLSTLIKAQQVYEQASTIYNNIERYSLNDSYYYSMGPIDHLFAGFQDDAPYDANTYRMRYSWNLINIPSNAEIQSAELTLQGTYTSNYPSSYTQTYVYVKKYETNFTDYSSSSWDYMTTAQTLTSQNIPRTISNFNFTKNFSTGDDFCNYLKSKFGGNFYLAITADESFFSGYSANVLDFYHGQVKLKFYYTVPASNVIFFADNNFTAAGNTNHGSMLIDGQSQTIPLTGYTITRLPGTNIQLGANSPQNDNQSHQMIWHTGTTAHSEWTKDGAYKNPDQNYSFTVQSDDNNSIYLAKLRKNYLINRINQTEFDGNQTLPGYIVEQNSGQISTFGNGYTPGTITYNFAGWTDNSTMSTTRTITPTDNQTYTALYKYLNHANTSAAYSNNSQKKLVRDTNGWLHKVYASMNMIWYERSTNNGATWTIQNNGKPLSSNNAKLPAIDFYGTSYIFITWQEEYGETFKIRLAYMSFPEAQLVFNDIWDPTIWAEYPPYSYDATPIVSWGAGNVLIVAWKFGGIMYRYGYCSNYSPITWYTSEYGEWISNTDENSANPTIAVRKDNGTSVFYLAWQQSTTAIKYRTLTPNVSSLTISAEETPSSGDNVNYKRNPSISVITTQPTLVWVGANYDGAIRKVYKRTRGTSSWGSFSIYGNEIESPTEYNGIIVWSEPNWVNKMFRWGSIKTLPTIGKYIQASNGPSANSMYAVVHRNVSPFEFQTTQSLGSLPKIIISNSGREGIISKGNAEFGFVIADVTCNGDVVAFENVNDTTVIANIGDLNNYLSTTAFTPNEGSDLVFSIAYGTNDSLEAINALNDGSNISFTLELVDANTNEILSTIDNFVFDENNICSYGEQSYNINMQGIGNRNVKLRATSITSFNGSYNLANIYAESNILGKNNSRELSFNGGSVITTYDLYQNYPNPFNPSTTIKYQIPNDGFVTLKVYDVLGNEVTTLINEQKQQGRYEVNFNSSSLASGVYVYKLQAGDFTSSRKMLLLK